MGPLEFYNFEEDIKNKPDPQEASLKDMQN